jgi:hypothetical protein
VEVRIGIQHSPREISFETDAPAEELRTTVESALSGGQQLVTFSDSKGKQFFVPTASIAYVEVGAEGGRKVGFIS